ncbi:MAG TPA: dihydrodipicolinate synthase family protein [Vicinamibacterales bacterium]|nr:dihydrodipicolinate synthase family protein [Vicinamibacterales bacterium]
MVFEGVFAVLPTPFDAGGDVDEASLRRVVRLYLEAGVDGLTALGVTSEVARLDDAERERVLAVVLDEVGGRVPVVAGTTAEGTRACAGYSRRAVAAGAAAVMVSPPRLAKPASEVIVRHYRAIADAIEAPIVIQDYPPVSGYAVEPWLLVRIAREVPQARVIKLEDAPTPFKTARILEAAGELELRILGGLGGVYLLEELLAGAHGAMTGFAFPELLVRIVRLFRAGRIEEAAELFYRTVPLMRFEFQESIGLAIRKEVLHRRGAIAHPGTRAPGPALDAATRAALDRVLAWVQAQEPVG